MKKKGKGKKIHEARRDNNNMHRPSHVMAMATRQVQKMNHGQHGQHAVEVWPCKQENKKTTHVHSGCWLLLRPLDHPLGFPSRVPIPDFHPGFPSRIPISDAVAECQRDPVGQKGSKQQARSGLSDAINSAVICCIWNNQVSAVQDFYRPDTKSWPRRAKEGRKKKKKR